MNYLMCSVGRRGELIKYFKRSIEPGSRIIAVDNSPYAPALYLADMRYLVPRIDSPEYIDCLLGICSHENVKAVLTFIDPEIMVLAQNRSRFEEIGVEVLVPYEETARLCFDKYEMYKYLTTCGLRTVKTWSTFEETVAAIDAGKASFPVFVKPRRGSGSVGARMVRDAVVLENAFSDEPSLIAQEYMSGPGVIDLDADVYVDTVTHKPVSIFAKKKLSTTIGGANKTVSFHDESLYDFITEIVKQFQFNGPIDMDFFYKDGKYYLSEVNPRFGGAYLHAYGAGVDFIKLIERNLRDLPNAPSFGDYEDGVTMMMYDSVVIKRPGELVESTDYCSTAK